MRIIAVVAIMMIYGGGMLSAQNNSYDMNDELYNLYKEAYKQRRSKEGVEKAEQIVKRAREIGDKNGEVVAMTIPFLYEFYQPDNLAGVKKSANALMAKAKACRAWNVYYFAVSNVVTYMVKLRQFTQAVFYIEEQKEFALAHNHRTGIRDIYYMLGTVQQYRGEYATAIKNYRDYVSYSMEHTPNANLTDAYLNICDCLRKTSRYDGLLAEVKKDMKFCKTGSDRYDMMVQRCYAHFMTGDYAAFAQDYDYLEKHRSDDRGMRAIVQQATDICKDIYDGNDEKAMKAIKDMYETSNYESDRLSVAYHRYHKDYKSAIASQWSLIDVFAYSSLGVLGIDEESLELMNKQQALERRQKEIEYRNTQLSLANSQLQQRRALLELERANDTTRLAKLRIERDRLDIQQRQLDTERLKDSIDQHQRLWKAESMRVKSNRRMQSVYLLFSFVITAVIVCVIMVRKRQSNRLREGIKKLNEHINKLDKAKVKAQESELLKTSFLQNMSHEIRTPLNAIVGFSSLLVSQGSELSLGERSDLVKYIRSNSQLLIALVDDILELADLQSGSSTIQKSKVNVNDLCHQMIETVRHRVAPGVELGFESSLPDKFVAYTDAKRVQQVLINMLTNAEKNTSEGSIVLRCMHTPGNKHMITFTVTDTGVGVPPEMMDAIFRRFKKLDRTKQGTGLGLDICRTIAEKLGGTIDIDRNYHTGARFIFTIPYRS